MTGHELPKVIEIEFRTIMESSVVRVSKYIFLIYNNTIYNPR